MGDIAYLEFYDGYVQQPCSQNFQLNECLKGRKKTKSEIATIYKTDLNVIRRITDYYFPLLWSTKQALKKCYSGNRINVWADDGYYQWFLMLCLADRFRFAGTTKVNHEYLLEWIESYKILFSWEMFIRDVVGYVPDEIDILRQIGEIRFLPEQIEQNYQLLEKIQKNEAPRIITKIKHNRTNSEIASKPSWLRH